MKIYVLCHSTRIVYGHGESGKELTLATEGGYSLVLLPAFKSASDASIYLREKDISAQIIELDLEGNK